MVPSKTLASITESKLVTGRGKGGQEVMGSSPVLHTALRGTKQPPWGPPGDWVNVVTDVGSAISARSPSSLSFQPPTPACPYLCFPGRLIPWTLTIPGTLLLTHRGLFCQLFWQLPRCYLQPPNPMAWISCWHLMWAWKCKEGLCISPLRLTTFQKGKSPFLPRVGRRLVSLLTGLLRVSKCLFKSS